MLLTLDIGNTIVTAGVYDGSDLRATWRFATDVEKLPDEYGVLTLSLLEHEGLDHREVKEAITGGRLPGKVPRLTTRSMNSGGPHCSRRAASTTATIRGRRRPEWTTGALVSGAWITREPRPKRSTVRAGTGPMTGLSPLRGVPCAEAPLRGGDQAIDDIDQRQRQHDAEVDVAGVEQRLMIGDQVAHAAQRGENLGAQNPDHHESGRNAQPRRNRRHGKR